MWSFSSPGRRPPVALVVVQHDALNEVAATVVGVLVTAVPQAAGEPVTVRLEPPDTGLDHPLWAKVTQVRTAATADARERLADLVPSARARVDAALAQVLGLGPPAPEGRGR